MLNLNLMKTHYYIEGLSFLIQKVKASSNLDSNNKNVSADNLFYAGNDGIWHSDPEGDFPIDIEVLFNREVKMFGLKFFMQPPSPQGETFEKRTPRKIEFIATSLEGDTTKIGGVAKKSRYLESEDNSFELISPKAFKAKKMIIRIFSNNSKEDNLTTIWHIDLL